MQSLETEAPTNRTSHRRAFTLHRKPGTRRTCHVQNDIQEALSRRETESVLLKVPLSPVTSVLCRDVSLLLPAVLSPPREDGEVRTQGRSCSPPFVGRVVLALPSPCHESGMGQADVITPRSTAASLETLTPMADEEQAQMKNTDDSGAEGWVLSP